MKKKKKEEEEIVVGVAMGGFDSVLFSICWSFLRYLKSHTRISILISMFENCIGIIGPNLYGLTVRDNEDGEEWFVVGHLAMAVDGILFTLSCLILWSIASR